LRLVLASRRQPAPDGQVGDLPSVCRNKRMIQNRKYAPQATTRSVC
jgi:hypothetical protein